MKPLHFIGSSLWDLKKQFPEEARSEVGFALYLAQRGDKGVNVIPLVGYGGANVLEIVINDDGDAYRAVYTIRFRKAVYVLHAFQKKSKRGIKTPMHDVDLINWRLKQAETHYQTTYERRKEAGNDQRSG